MTSLNVDESTIAEIQRVIDESKIRYLLNSYPRAVDRMDFDLMRSLFHPDAVDEHGAFNGPAAEFVDYMEKTYPAGTYFTHHNGTQLIDIDGDVARCETYCIALGRLGQPGEEGYGSEFFNRVRYLDRVERRDGIWKIAHRRVIYSPCHIADASTAFPLSSDCLVEDVFPHDPAYRW
jgi:hypothetical protein